MSLKVWQFSPFGQRGKKKSKRVERKLDFPEIDAETFDEQHLSKILQPK